VTCGVQRPSQERRPVGGARVGLDDDHRTRVGPHAVQRALEFPAEEVRVGNLDPFARARLRRLRRVRIDHDDAQVGRFAQRAGDVGGVLVLALPADDHDIQRLRCAGRDGMGIGGTVRRLLAGKRDGAHGCLIGAS